jgi:hypothetical protein
MKSSNWHGGKGSGRRSSQDDKKYSDNWDAIFGKKVKQVNEKFPNTLESLDDTEYPQRDNINNRTHD